MANICSNKLTIKGCAHVVKDLYKRLLTHSQRGEHLINLTAIADPNPARIYTVCYADHQRGCLSLSFDSAWSPPTDWLTDISLRYPGLTFNLLHEEGGNDEYGEIDWFFDEYGEQQINELEYTKHEWLLITDPIYVGEYKKVTEGDYDEFIKGYRDPGSFDDLFTDNTETLKESILKRIKREDLPLFINHDWEGLKDEFHDRITKGDVNVCQGEGA